MGRRLYRGFGGTDQIVKDRAYAGTLEVQRGTQKSVQGYGVLRSLAQTHVYSGTAERTTCKETLEFNLNPEVPGVQLPKAAKRLLNPERPNNPLFKR